MTLLELRDVLISTGIPVNHYTAMKKPDKYIVWAEDMQSGSLYSDNSMSEQVLQGTIDYFTKMEFDPNFDKIQQALKDNDVSFSLNSVQFEEDTQFIHFEWIFEVC